MYLLRKTIKPESFICQSLLIMESISLSQSFKVSCKEVYDGWLDSKIHSEFTGGEAVIEPSVGFNFTAWDGYISGAITELEDNHRIVQTWRTSEFADSDPDSVLEITLNELHGETILTIDQRNIPIGEGEKYKKGWIEHYFQPMVKYYGI